MFGGLAMTCSDKLSDVPKGKWVPFFKSLSWRIYVRNFASYMPVTLICDHHVIDGMCCYGYNYVSKWTRLGNGSDGYISRSQMSGLERKIFIYLK
uniref:Chloramphenicol acetyltransferase-like domain-containing protein n=1 Tax=Helianthus annuus TaxID=4232 RepID=A0A251U345_HELAN